MYLIHAQFKGPAGALFPDTPTDALRMFALPEEQIEHLTIHACALPNPVLGIWARAESLALAEARAAAFCRRLLAHHHPLRNWTLQRAEVPLLAPLVQGRLGPAGTTSTPPDQRGK
ncbi:hypothetical protein AB0M28_21890 [Streptomyces sp. NPDC051940]|uniref:hypothetical protein n=1 Tax=Streptomyces sp. NPDC051940 TaxID=3155675 RepID=UPI003432C30A